MKPASESSLPSDAPSLVKAETGAHSRFTLLRKCRFDRRPGWYILLARLSFGITFRFHKTRAGSYWM